MARILYQYQTCPFSGKVRRRLRQLGVRFERFEVPRDDPSVLAGLGFDKVPVLVDGDTVRNESARICAYLDATYGS